MNVPASPTSMPRATLTPVPSLDAIARDPARAAELPGDERRRIVSRLAALIVLLESGPGPNAETPAEYARVTGDDRLLRVPEAAALLSFARSYIYELIRRGELPAVRSGKHVRLRRSSLLEWARSHESA